MSQICSLATTTPEHRFATLTKSMKTPCSDLRIANAEITPTLLWGKHSLRCVPSPTGTCGIRIPRRQSIDSPTPTMATALANPIRCGTGAFCLTRFPFRISEYLDYHFGSAPRQSGCLIWNDRPSLSCFSSGDLHGHDFDQQLYFDDCSRRHPRCFFLTTINLQNQTTLAET